MNISFTVLSNQTSKTACEQSGPFPWAALCVPMAWLVVSLNHGLETTPAVAPAKLGDVGLPETLSRSALGPSHVSHHTLLSVIRA